MWSPFAPQQQEQQQQYRSEYQPPQQRPAPTSVRVAHQVVKRSAAREPAAVEPPFLWMRVRTHGQAPEPTCCHSACLYKDRYIITFGGGGRRPGEQRSRCVNTVSCLDLDTNVWRVVETRNSEMVCPRTAHSAVVYGDKMIVYGGHPLSHQPLIFGEVLELDLLTWTWRLVHEVPSEPEGPGERYMHTASVWRGRMYVVMGVAGSGAALMWYLDLADYTWHRVPRSSSLGAPKLSLCGHNACVDGDALYIFGGEARAETINPRTGVVEHDMYSYANTVYRYDFLRNEWTMPVSVRSFAPRGRYASAMGMLDGRLYVFGGDRDGSRVYFDDFWTFDTRRPNAHWQEIGLHMRHGPVDCQRPSKRTGMAAVVARGALYLLGGEVAPKNPDEDDDLYTNEVFRYPLTISLEAPLSDSLARWLSRCSVNTLTAATLYPSLPLTARELLRSYLPVRESFFSNTLDERTSSTSSDSSETHQDEEGEGQGEKTGDTDDPPLESHPLAPA